MLVIEKEARKKRCPNNRKNNCVTSGCMMWRWYDGPGGRAMFNRDYSLNYLEPRLRRGYCGLAGKPEDPGKALVFPISKGKFNVEIPESESEDDLILEWPGTWWKYGDDASDQRLCDAPKAAEQQSQHGSGRHGA